MECHISRGILRLRCFKGRTRYASAHDVKTVNVMLSSFDWNEKRLYHKYISPHSITSRFDQPNSTSSSVLFSRNYLLLRPAQTRNLVISRIIEAFRSADVTSVAGLSNFIIESTPVTAVRSVYEWSESLTGLPWGANILLCSFVLQLIFNVPVNVYMTRWATAKEKQAADLLAIQGSMIRSPGRGNVALFNSMPKHLAKQYGCETSKLVVAIMYQVVYVTISSFGVRSLLVKSDQASFISDSTLPWGALLGSPDPVFPIVNVLINLLLVEVGAWRKLNSQEGQKLTCRRASMPYQSEPLYLLNLRRFCSLPFIIIYCVVPSAMTLHWFAMISTALNVQILMAHRQTRQTLGIPSCYYETDKPYREFLQYLKRDCSVFRK